MRNIHTEIVRLLIDNDPLRGGRSNSIFAQQRLRICLRVDAAPRCMYFASFVSFAVVDVVTAKEANNAKRSYLNHASVY